jgi:hypothetical protein
MKNKKILVERYRLGELPRSWKKRLNRDTLDSEVKEIAESDQEILTQYNPSLMAEKIEARRKESHKKQPEAVVISRKRSFLSYGMAAAAILVLALILPGVLRESSNYGPEEMTRIKGNDESVLKVYRKSGDRTETLTNDSLVREGDLIQLGFRVSQDFSYAVIISLDGRGVVTRHLAPEGKVSEKQVPGSEHLLPFSYELDDAPFYETFYLIQSDKPFPVDPLIDLLAKEARRSERVLNIPDIVQKSKLDAHGWGEISQYAVSLKKEE